MESDRVNFSSVGEPKKLLMTILRDRPEINYESCRELIGKLISTYLNDLSIDKGYNDNEIRNLVYTNRLRICEEIYKQMMRHYKEKATGLIEVISSISYDIKSPLYDRQQLLNALYIYDEIPFGLDIKSCTFKGGSKWLTEFFKFDSGSERSFAISLENDRKVIHWLRLARDQFDLQYKFEGINHNYEPDFVVETEDACYLVEIKRRNEMDDPMVIAKKERALSYCKIASKWCIANHSKSWKYMLIPHDRVTETTSFDAYILHFVVN